MRGWTTGRTALGLALVLLLPAPALRAQVKFETTSCARCHAELDGELLAPVQGLRAGDVHATVGLTCADCHGGDPVVPPGTEPDQERAHAKTAGFRGKPRPTEIPDLCARCHSDPAFIRRFNPNLPTDQLARYRTSIHGQRIAKGDEHVATCASCHGAHGILRVQDPRAPVYALHIPETCGRCHADAALMAPYGIPATQLQEYRTSVHGVALYKKNDLSAPTCNDCHGNHGAAPPGVSSVAFVCGECHVTSRGFFAASPHKEAFDAAQLPECTACHGNHAITPVSDRLVGADSDAWCARCHSPGDKGLDTARQLRGLLDGLASQIDTAQRVVDRAGRDGMDVSTGELRLQDAHTSLVQSRDLVHTLDPKRTLEAATAGEKAAKEALAVGVSGLRERDVRRKGLAVSLFFIAVVAIALYATIRKLDRRAGLD